MGADSVRQGMQAGLFGAAMVLVFMLIYYRFRGLAADVALVVTILLIFTGLIAFHATLTLPGIAGIILRLGVRPRLRRDALHRPRGQRVRQRRRDPGPAAALRQPPAERAEAQLRSGLG